MTQCPICKTATVHEFRPFCSKLCKDKDLINWASGAYVSSRPLDENDLENLYEEIPIPPLGNHKEIE